MKQEPGATLDRLIELDRKSTRLNSSHRCISYAVFCLKKKKKRIEESTWPLNLSVPPPPLGTVCAITSATWAASGGGSFFHSRLSSSSHVLSTHDTASS